MSRTIPSRMAAGSVNKNTLSSSEDEIIVTSESCAKGTPGHDRGSRKQVQSPLKNAQRPRSGLALSSESDGFIVASSKKALKSKKGNRPDDASEDELALEDPRSDVWKGREESFAVVVPPRRLFHSNPSSQNVKAGLMASGGKSKRLKNNVAGKSYFQLSTAADFHSRFGLLTNI